MTPPLRKRSVSSAGVTSSAEDQQLALVGIGGLSLRKPDARWRRGPARSAVGTATGRCEEGTVRLDPSPVVAEHDRSVRTCPVAPDLDGLRVIERVDGTDSHPDAQRRAKHIVWTVERQRVRIFVNLR